MKTSKDAIKDFLTTYHGEEPNDDKIDLFLDLFQEWDSYNGGFITYDESIKMVKNTFLKENYVK